MTEKQAAKAQDAGSPHALRCTVRLHARARVVSGGRESG